MSIKPGFHIILSALNSVGAVTGTCHRHGRLVLPLTVSTVGSIPDSAGAGTGACEADIPQTPQTGK